MLRRRSRLLAVALFVTSGWVFSSTFLEVQGKPQRRDVVTLLGSQVIFAGAMPAYAGDRDRATMVLNVRRKYLPRILDVYKQLQADGSLTKFAEGEKATKRFIDALMQYASIQRLSEAPDKYSKKLKKDAKEVEAFFEKDDYAGVMSMLETYRQDIPGSPGNFEWTDTA
eukprot:TRINITY_DN45495_c0_g1_i1.p1 TRINITY_DN45495_c0_g1~~TRINITY_DN45495_c0_g1_i1.p1  ORF type:complete len:169 (-),score=34.22 TRINITY_DN45495_c0_g1_i1:143-649(-)